MRAALGDVHLEGGFCAPDGLGGTALGNLFVACIDKKPDLQSVLEGAEDPSRRVSLLYLMGATFIWQLRTFV